MNQVDLSYEADLSPESVWLTITASSAAKNGLIYVQEAGDFIAGPRYYTNRRNLPSYLIKYTLSGEGMLKYGGKEYGLKPGRMFFIDCMEPQYYSTAAHAENWRILWVHFYGGSSGQYYNIFKSASENAAIDIPPESRIPEYLTRILSIYKDGRGIMTDIYAAETLTRLLTESVSAASGITDDSAAPAYIKKARAFLSSNYAEKITLDDAASYCCVNKFHLLKQFKRYTGYTPHEYVILCRLNAAKTALRSTDKSISEIASESGMENTSHFINLFKRYENTTPHAYRRSWNN